MKFICLTFSLMLCSALADKVKVGTSVGEVSGTVKTVQDHRVEAYLGIPFAKPPVGELRFQPPVKADPWEGTYKATKQPPACLQVKKVSGFEDPETSIPGSITEDCLYLNVWTPNSKDSDLKPVMVWFYGGGFFMGTISLPVYDGSVLSAFNDVVVVSVNYRLGIFGFLDASIPEAPGNVGLLDQQLALKWVQENIKSFGGDPDSVTIFGESAGSMSVNLHILSPLSTGLFKRAIMMSGTNYVSSLTDLPQVSLLKGSNVAKAIGCATVEKDLRSHPQEVIECLRTKPADELFQISHELAQPNFVTFAPTYNNEFCPKAPILLTDRGQFNNVDALIGVTANEGSLFFALLKPEYIDPQLKSLSAEEVYSISKNAMLSWNVEIINEAYEFYASKIDRSDKIALRQLMVDYLSDYLFVCPVNYFSERYSDRGNNVYLYQFSHRSAKSLLPSWTGTPHFFDVPFLFGRPFVAKKKFTDDDRELSRHLMRIFTSFAKTGKPELPSGEEWPKFNRQTSSYVDIKFNNYSAQKSIRAEQCEFWRKYI